LLIILLVFASLLARTLATEALRTILPRYLGLELTFFAVYMLILWKPGLPAWVLQVYLLLQVALVLRLLAYWPEFDFVVLLFVLLAMQVALFFSGWVRWTWIALLVLLTGGTLVYHLGLLRGLGLSLTTMVGEIVIAGYIIATQEIDRSRRKSQELLDELTHTNQKLKEYTAQVEELASMQERNRLARELHDSVSQLLFSISLTNRSAQLLLDKEPARLPELLVNLQEMTASALGLLRAFITQLHPPPAS
jgi:signal transduction histidine kinase